MFKTRVTETLGIKYPIILGGMAGISSPELVAAVSNAGGLGIITCTNYLTPEELREGFRKIKSLTNKPFGANINLFPAVRERDINKDIDVIIDEGVAVVESSGGNPTPYISRLKEAGVKTIHKVAIVRHAQIGEKAGADIIAIVGTEAGGHPPPDDVTSLILIPLVVDAVKAPVVAGGGFCDGRSFVAALALGAEGVLMGTRFVATKECIAHPKVKDWIVNAKESDTMIIQRSIRSPTRVARNAPAEKTLEMEMKGASLQELLPVIGGERGRSAWSDGDINAGVISVGMVVGRINEVLTVKEVIEGIISEATEICKKLNIFTK